MITYLVQGIVYGFAAAVQPGPLQTYMIVQTLRNGWRKTIVYSLVPVLSDLPIIALVLIVLAQVPPAFILGIRFIGGFFLLYLAVNVIRTIRMLTEEPDFSSGEAGIGLLKAVMVNFLNPNPYVYWGLISGPILVAGWRETPVNGIALLAGFYATMIPIMAALIIAFSIVRRMPIVVRKVMMGISAAGLAFFGCYQIWLGISQAIG
jgi:threonine/homoserine/homoserine lactone efflux protein